MSYPHNQPGGWAWFARFDAPVRASLLMIGAGAGFSVMMAVARLGSPEIPPLEAVSFLVCHRNTIT